MYWMLCTPNLFMFGVGQLCDFLQAKELDPVVQSIVSLTKALVEDS